MSTIKGALAARIVKVAGIGNRYDIKRHIDIAVEKKLISHEDATHLKQDYEKLYLGKPLQKEKIKNLMTRLKDKDLNIPGTHLRTLAANAQQTIERETRKFHAQEHEKSIEENRAHQTDIQSSENEQDKKKKEEEEKKKKDKEAAQALLHAPINISQQRIARQHEGQTPIGKTLSGKKAA
jgi:hypothetical protein